MSSLQLSQQISSLDLVTLSIIIGATSCGTVLGLSLVYWLLQFDLPAKLQAAILTFSLLLVAFLVLFKPRNFKSPTDYLITKKDKFNEIQAKSKHSSISRMIKVQSGLHLLESKLLEEGKDTDPFTRAVEERNEALGINPFSSLKKEEFYKSAYGKCCESVIGEVWLPVGVAGPIPLVGKDGVESARNIYVPLATVEGALVASVNRGCKVLRRSFENDQSSLSCIVSSDRKGITRGPSFRAISIESAAEFLKALHDPERFKEWRSIFDSSSPGGHVKLLELRGRQIGFLVYVRVRTETSEAMGMNMISRGCSVLFDYACNLPEFEGKIRMESMSGNFCVDKKPAAINWIQGRGREVIVSARIPREILKEVFGINDIESLEKLNYSKNIIGSAAAGSIGGFNAHVANVVAAIYLATGQDVAQVVDASQAMTLLEYDRVKDELVATLTMPCVEIGIRGGGTGLPHQQHFLQMILGDSELTNGADLVDELARCIGLVSLAGELSLLASLQAGTLVSSHFKLNH